MDQDKFIKIIDEAFEDDQEVREVAMYALSTLTINESIVRSIGQQTKNAMAEVPPEAYILMKRYDNGMIHNEFWQQHFVAIKSQLALDDIKLNTMASYILYFEAKKDIRALQQVRAMQLARFDVFTLIAMFYKGVTFAEEFDAKVRIVVEINEQHNAFFKRNGLGE